MIVDRACRLFVPMMAVCLAIPTRADDSYTISTDHIYGHKAGMALTLDVVRPDSGGNGIGLIYMVSRGWVSNYFDLDDAMSKSKQRSGRFFQLIDRGYTLLMVRHGSSPFFKVPDAVSDVRRAVRYIRHHSGALKVDPDRLGVFGNSAGGHLALMLALAPDDGDPESDDPVERASTSIAAVVAYYPPVDLRGSSAESGPLDFDPEQQPAVSPITHASSDDPPALLIHGDQDNLVPLSGSEQLLQTLRAAGVDSQLIVMAGAGHAFPGTYGSDAANALAEWFDRHLAAK